MGIEVNQLREFVVRPTLKSISLWSEVAEILVPGTGIIESRLSYIKQLGGGPAVSIYQIEPATYADLLERLVRYNNTLYKKVLATLGMKELPTTADYLMGNLTAATIFCRLKYYLHPDPLPVNAEDHEALAAYYKKIYNTPLGKADPYVCNAVFKSIIRGYAYHG